MNAMNDEDVATSSAEGLRRDAAAGVAAYAAAGIGISAVAALGIMYVVETPRGGPYRFGRYNDFAGGLFYAATIPVIVQVHRRLPPTRAGSAGLTTVVAASGAAAASGLLLALRLVPWGASTAVTVAGIATQSAWVAATMGRMPRPSDFPVRLARTGQTIGMMMLAALPLVGASYAAGSTPRLRKVLWALGGGLGSAAYAAWPVWLLAVGRQLRRPARSGRA